MASIVVLGSGMVGHVIAQDLAQVHQVVVVDKNPSSLEKLNRIKNIRTQVADVQNKDLLYTLVQQADLVVIALPGFMAFEVLKHVIECGKSVVDISFYPENALDLNTLAKEKKVTVIVDSGVAPGMSNFLLGYHYATGMQIDEFICYVGGLPIERTFPFEYKAPFSPSDVIEEYIRPARLKEHGQIVVKPALSEIELIYFEGIGTLEAFNTDGLRSLLYTMNIPNMKEKTLRYPGHATLIQALKTIGFFDEQEREINHCRIRPIQLSTQLLRDAWKLRPNEEEFTVMRVIIKGKENGQSVQYTYDLLDKYDKLTGFTSMSRTTGFACTAMAQLILEKKLTQHGVFPPELVALNKDIFKYVMTYLTDRKVHYRCSVNT